jgi:hypothetical protein
VNRLLGAIVALLFVCVVAISYQVDQINDRLDKVEQSRCVKDAECSEMIEQVQILYCARYPEDETCDD